MDETAQAFLNLVIFFIFGVIAIFFFYGLVTMTIDNDYQENTYKENVKHEDEV
jgi:predicted RND superfamily exporter protein